jgi:hypothetical protein
VAKKKNSKSLFEVLSSGSVDASLDVPSWMKNPPVGPGPAEAGEPQQAPPLPVEDQVEQAEEIDEEFEEELLAEQEAPAEESDIVEADVESGLTVTIREQLRRLHEIGKRLVPARPPAGKPSDRPLRLEGDRLCVSVNFITAMLILGGVLVLLVTAFVLGRVTGGTSPEVQSPAGDEPAKLALQPVGDGAAKLAPPGQRDANRYYLIIETLKGKTDQDHDEAERILGFCLKQGLPADMVTIGRPPNEKLALWCRLGYVSPTSPAAIEHARKAEAVGKEYFKEYGTYKFLQRRKGKFSPFFFSGKSE